MPLAVALGLNIVPNDVKSYNTARGWCLCWSRVASESCNYCMYF